MISEYDFFKHNIIDIAIETDGYNGACICTI